jgi:hypothetical protein
LTTRGQPAAGRVPGASRRLPLVTLARTTHALLLINETQCTAPNAQLSPIAAWNHALLRFALDYAVDYVNNDPFFIDSQLSLAATVVENDVDNQALTAFRLLQMAQSRAVAAAVGGYSTAATHTLSTLGG